MTALNKNLTELLNEPMARPFTEPGAKHLFAGHELGHRLDATAAALARPAPSGAQQLQQRLVEISAATACGRYSTAVEVVCQAQAQGARVAWIERQGHGGVYPPDVAHSGVDVEALAWIRVPNTAGVWGMAKAAEIILRSGAFGCVVLDFLAGAPPRPEAWQGRLLTLARQHYSSVILLSQRPASASSAGPLVSLRVQPSITPCSTRLYTLQTAPLKQKGGATWPWPSWQRRGPEGLG